MKKALTLCILLIFFFFPITVFAVEPFSVPNISKNKPIEIVSTKIEISRAKNKIFFYDNVKVIQEDSELLADKMIANYKENGSKGKTEFLKIDAYDNVKFFSKKLFATGDNGYYDIKKNEFVIIGNVVINDDGMIAYGDRLEYNAQTKETRILGDKKEKGRVTIILDDIDKIEKRVEETKKEDKKTNAK